VVRKKCAQIVYRPIDIVREQSTGAATRWLLQRKKLCQSAIFFANGATAGAAVHPKTTDPTSWEVEVPWQPSGPGW
jgi:hypothetical protein